MPKLTPPSVNCKNSFIWPPSRALRWLRKACPRRRDTATAPGAPYAAFGPAPAARRLGEDASERVSHWRVLLEAQVVLAECLVGREHGGVLGGDHPADVEHHAGVGDGQRAAGVLLDQHHGQP